MFSCCFYYYLLDKTKQNWHLDKSQLLLATNVSVEMLAQGVQEKAQVFLKVTLFLQSFQGNKRRNVMTADSHFRLQIKLQIVGFEEDAVIGCCQRNTNALALASLQEVVTA